MKFMSLPRGREECCRTSLLLRYAQIHRCCMWTLGLEHYKATPDSLSILTRTRHFPIVQGTYRGNMFSKLSVVVTSVLITIAVATIGPPAPPSSPPLSLSPPPPITTPTSPQCCANIVSASSEIARIIAAIVHVDLTWVFVDVGLSCSQIGVVGDDCRAITAMCDEPPAEWGDLMAINCIPLTH
ncbi:Hydrophobin 2 [Mycena venus]|uniref:Hydrophobin n=1 Tax=Mycena venus TaxID=2733690 RepID=A0A8H6YGC4_9AGAR|nr:Hydrophobin 2 [Mycena venus]